jgi:hypothetical protein
MFALLFMLYCICIAIGFVFMFSLWVDVYIPYLDTQKQQYNVRYLSLRNINRIRNIIYKFCFISFIMIIFGFLSPIIYVLEKYKY